MTDRVGPSLAKIAVIAAMLSSPLPAAAQMPAHCNGVIPPESLLGGSDFNAPMQYRAETRNGTRILIAAGVIGPNEGARLAQALDAHRPEEVWLHSPGGNARAGPAMGRELRRRHLLVRVPQNAVCFSSCSLAFLGGEVRLVDPGGFYGVHVFSGGAELMPGAIRIVEAWQRYQALPAAQRQQNATIRAVQDTMIQAMAPIQREDAMLSALIARYLVEMALSLDLLTEMFGTAFHERCWVGRQGLVRYNVVNSGN